MNLSNISSIHSFIIKLFYFIVFICMIKELMNSLHVMGYQYIHQNSNENQHLQKIQMKKNNLTNKESLYLPLTYDNLSDHSIVHINRKDVNYSNYSLSVNNTTIQYDNISTVASTDVRSQSVEANNNNTTKDNNNDDNVNNNGNTHSVAQISQITTDNNQYKNDNVKKNLLKLQNKHKSITNSSIKFMRYNTGDTIQLKCRIPKGPYLVLWNKLGLDYPLTIGKNRFIPDERFEIQYKPPNRWNLIISNAQLNDTGVYSCTSGSEISNSHSNVNNKSDLRHYQEYQPQSEKNRYRIHTAVTDATKTKKQSKGREYYVSVVEPLPSERYQVDVPFNKIGMKNKTITVTGPNLVFYGTPLELICRASFPSSEAKLDPTISLEWYHRGVRRLSHPFRSGGVYITMQWLDSHLLESRLYIAWVNESEAGQWICLERSNPIKNINYTKLSSSSSLSSMSNYRNAQMNEFNKQSLPLYHNTSIIYSPSNIDLVYDKIYIEIIDIPDTTFSVQMTTQSTIFTVPTVSSLSSQPNGLLSSSSSSLSSSTSPLSSSSIAKSSSTLFSSSFNQKFSKSNTNGISSKHLYNKPEKLSFIERLIRSMNHCTRLQINKQILLIFNIFNNLLLIKSFISIHIL
ncbi:hypothetical protein MS3_00008513 [Schistosoma haematobium]|uniref:Ig-like domain-containing protein n=2 Tax=Schistosoma haematobium TaxID=6185 RepID=A0A922LFB7_SCHHA|nr:hypothetical protein MS3_00008513 [Schistosoma haematobium]KAH9581336.1 hypothetical protein MS3_00008513 [Schistosoma haematobium]CAH8629477.1 unnamed protein product [Schistosoma haematobium]